MQKPKIIEEANIEVQVGFGKTVTVTIYPDQKNSLFQATDVEIEKFGEAEYQLSEGCLYEYSLSDTDYQLEAFSPIIKPSKRENSGSGLIRTNIYTGLLKVSVINSSCEKVGSFYLEIRSIKTDYRKDYRLMLEEITEYCTEIIMQHSSPTSMSFNIDHNSGAKCSYQRFSFIKSIILSEEFQEGIHRVITSPVVNWGNDIKSVDIRNVGRISRYEARQISSSQRRVKFDNRFGSLPDKINTVVKTESVDTPENRFIKHVLEAFSHFMSKTKSQLQFGSLDFKEAVECEVFIEELLSHSVFREISRPQHINLNSPVLQRKEGYREVYRAWIMFDLAARLDWAAGEDIFQAGKRNVATLYEYWLFFKLLELMKDIFEIENIDIDRVIESNDHGFSLKLKSGDPITIDGVYSKLGRTFRVNFNYNKTFTQNDNYLEEGSWSLNLRPDYTLTIWPNELSKDQAEEQELILHIHFDAKYKVANYSDLFNGNENVPIESIENMEIMDKTSKNVVYKNVDVLKMHAYKDAIKRTAGAYILYPGDAEGVNRRGFHELIPGLGAFSVRPSKSDNGILDVRSFIKEVLANFIMQNSMYERLTYYRYDTYKRKESFKNLNQFNPTEHSNIREKHPSDIPVLVGYIRSEKQSEWINKNDRYNIRFDSSVTPELIGAGYMILYDKYSMKSTRSVYRVVSSPKLWTKKSLEDQGYYKPSKDEYFVYEIERFDLLKENNHISLEAIRNTNNISGFSPFCISLSELLNFIVQ